MAANRRTEDHREDAGAAGARLADQERQDPSGHGMQVRPGQQREVAKADATNANGAVAECDPETLDDLKGEETTPPDVTVKP